MQGAVRTKKKKKKKEKREKRGKQKKQQKYRTTAQRKRPSSVVGRGKQMCTGPLALPWIRDSLYCAPVYLELALFTRPAHQAIAQILSKQYTPDNPNQTG